MHDPATRLFFLFQRAQHLVFRGANRSLQQQVGVPLAQVSALFALEAGALSQRELGKALGLEGPAISTLVARMESSDLLRREPDREDARIYRLYLSARGREVRDRARAVVDALGEGLTNAFTTAELATVSRFFETLLARALLSGSQRPR